MTEASRKKLIMGNILFVAVTELAIIHGTTPLRALFTGFFDVEIPGASANMQIFFDDAIDLFSDVITIAVTLLFMLVVNREGLRVFGGGLSRGLKCLGIGLLVGGGLNAVISLAVGASGSVEYSFRAFDPLVLAIIPFCAIQCASEEVLLRGYVPAQLEEGHSWDVVAFVGGTLFVFHHVGNMMMLGFNWVFCLNVFLLGVVFYLMVRICGSFWVALGCHTAWNYTQEYLFGLPNSGFSSEFAIFIGNNPQNSFFFNTTYGNEGSFITVVVLTIAAIVLMALLHRKA